MRDDNFLHTLARDDLDKLPSDMRQLISEMLRKDFNRRPTCRQLLNNKIITSHVSSLSQKSVGKLKFIAGGENGQEA